MRKFDSADGEHAIFQSRECYAHDCSAPSQYTFGCGGNSDIDPPICTNPSSNVSSFEIPFYHACSSLHQANPCQIHPQTCNSQAPIPFVRVTCFQFGSFNFDILNHYIFFNFQMACFAEMEKICFQSWSLSHDVLYINLPSFAVP